MSLSSYVVCFPIVLALSAIDLHCLLATEELLAMAEYDYTNCKLYLLWMVGLSFPLTYFSDIF